MPVRDILQLGHPILWRKCAPVDNPASPETKTIIADLEDTLKAFCDQNGYGRGIAAPQIGQLKRIVHVRKEVDKRCKALINPKILWESQERVTIRDDCLSFPELMVQVSRAERIRVNYLNEQGTEITLEPEGDLSELLQHEIDHLDGILTIERAISPQAFMTRAEWERVGRPKY
jgi:peptide deformylase